MSQISKRCGTDHRSCSEQEKSRAQKKSAPSVATPIASCLSKFLLTHVAAIGSSISADLVHFKAIKFVLTPLRPDQLPTRPNRLHILKFYKPEMVKSIRPKRRVAASFAIDLDGDGYLRLNEVLAAYPVSRASWYAGIKDDLYPKPVQLGKRSVGWSRKSIRELIATPPEF